MSSTTIDVYDAELHYTCLIIMLCPIIWNILARFCYFITPINASKYRRYLTCYLLTIWIFSFSSYRDYLIRQTIQRHGKSVLLETYSGLISPLAVLLFIVGQTFVWSSFYKLGITGTFLGDYCGILMDAPVTTFPFNILNNPMYVGSSLSFFAMSLYYSSPTGLLVTGIVYIFYQIAVFFEEPYTQKIYAQKHK